MNEGNSCYIALAHHVEDDPSRMSVITVTTMKGRKEIDQMLQKVLRASFYGFWIERRTL